MTDTKAAVPPPPPPVGSFQDDDPLVPRQTAGGAANGGLVLKAQCEFPALGRGASRDKFAVLVDAKAPADVARAPLDLVTVLDVSSSMKGQKLALLKQAVGFVVDQLGPADRLSVVTFSGDGRRLTHLARMSAAGKTAAKQAVEALAVGGGGGGTNIGAGLRVGAKVLVGRRHRNAVASMILLSDGHDMEVKSGSYGNHVAADGRAASIDVGELYDDEGRRFLVLVYVPRARATEEVTRLVKVSCTYRYAATGQTAHVAAPAAVIQRPLELTNMPPPSMDVERERVRLAAAEGIAAALVAADGGEHAGAARILNSRLREVERSAPVAAGDDPT
ncbi:uncharacterized protein C2845_PM02G13160 [Panicum miliaceum]|uniref:VWFA domain-containing protein n=1 Tax=Panicum miliaceum TaxID=4540 RepID=A0A3L6S5X5_PANMI|nr:uncharacterized protein C2845_PM02G13160 [Panicum miliaceum]